MSVEVSSDVSDALFSARSVFCMLREFNILVATCDMINDGYACSELWMLLRAVVGKELSE
jgi:hypothetical protein